MVLMVEIMVLEKRSDSVLGMLVSMMVLMAMVMTLVIAVMAILNWG